MAAPAAEPPRRLKAVEDYENGSVSIKIGDVIFVPNFDEQKGKMLKGVSAGKLVSFPRTVVEDTTIVHEVGNVTAVRAIHDYTAKKEGELSFPLGAKMFVVHRVDDKWWRGVYNDSDGLIPADHIQAANTRQVVTAADGSSAKAALKMAADHKTKHQAAQKKKKAGPPVWDWGKLAKDRAERELRGQPEGTFLVRASESQAHTYAISVVSNGAVRHIRLHNKPDGFAINAQDAAQPSIPALVHKLQGRSVQVRPKGTSGKGSESKLLVKPLPRLPSGPPACCWNAKPVVSGGGGGGGGGSHKPPGSPSLRKAAEKLPPAPKGPPGGKRGSASSAGSAGSAGGTVPDFAMSGEETRVYGGLWERVIDPGANHVLAPAAASFFQTSGVDRVALGHIWNAADIVKPSGQLSKKEFFVALKLIALKQAGQTATVANLQAATALPKLEGHTDKVLASLKPAAAAAPAFGQDPFASAPSADPFAAPPSGGGGGGDH